MFNHVRGRVTQRSPARVVLEAGGVGYDLAVPLSTYENLPADGEVTLLVHLQLRDDRIRLYGFLTDEERELFRLLLTVSGIGPVMALAALSGSSARILMRAIVEEDLKTLTRIKGIGTRTAQRMVLELKGKIGTVHIDEGMMKVLEAESGNDAVAALLSLGAGQSAAEYAVYRAERLLGDEAEVEDLIAQAIKLLSS